MSDAELRASVEPLDQLLDERQHLVEKVAHLWSLYGPGGTAESIRKNEQMRLQGMVRAMAVAAAQKVTEGGIEEAARSHADYLGLTARQTTERAEFFRLNAQLEAIDLKINRGQALLRMYASEARLG